MSVLPPMMGKPAYSRWSDVSSGSGGSSARTGFVTTLAAITRVAATIEPARKTAAG
jgi:hypothetical protein